MTITFKHENGFDLGRINSKVPVDTIKQNVKNWANQCASVWISCSDKPDARQIAKTKLMNIGMSQKFEQTEPTEVESQFEGQVSFVMNRVPLTSVEDNTDWGVEMLMGN